jgi:hypothetical protein
MNKSFLLYINPLTLGTSAPFYIPLRGMEGTFYSPLRYFLHEALFFGSSSLRNVCDAYI